MDLDLRIAGLLHHCASIPGNLLQTFSCHLVSPTYTNGKMLVHTTIIIILSFKGPTINDLGGGRGKIENGFIFSAGMPIENNMVLESVNFFLGLLTEHNFFCRPLGQIFFDTTPPPDD